VKELDNSIPQNNEFLKNLATSNKNSIKTDVILLDGSSDETCTPMSLLNKKNGTEKIIKKKFKREKYNKGEIEDQILKSEKKKTCSIQKK